MNTKHPFRDLPAAILAIAFCWLVLIALVLVFSFSAAFLWRVALAGWSEGSDFG